jgi:DNA (cytosine-5)-methyltransferase 1
VELHEGDIREVKSFPKADVLIGCYPCTGFSMAARRRWKDRDTRDLRANDDNFLYREFIRVLRQVQPKYLFVENVGGMVTAENGWFLDRQLQGFKKHGYRNVKRQVMTASDFGVAHDRKRMFIVGVSDDINDFDYQFPHPTHGNSHKQRLTLEDVISGMEEWPKGEYCDKPFHGHYLTRNRKRGWKEQSYTIVAHSHHVPLHPMGKPMKYIGKDHWELQGKSNRRLSWLECAMIQGLPPHIKPAGSLNDRYRVVGNAVPLMLGQAIVEPVIKYESA